VQFANAASAQSATSLDGETIEGLPLLAKLSDPSHKQARSGAMAEGREVYVANVDWGASEAELSELFAKHGTVEKVRLPRKVDGKSKGMAFIVFSTKVRFPSPLNPSCLLYSDLHVGRGYSITSPELDSIPEPASSRGNRHRKPIKTTNHPTRRIPRRIIHRAGHDLQPNTSTTRSS
jgi:RNA recognition motif. (a.k.a. RRM, RBD, or RNP domain)